MSPACVGTACQAKRTSCDCASSITMRKPVSVIASIHQSPLTCAYGVTRTFGYATIEAKRTSTVLVPAAISANPLLPTGAAGADEGAAGAAASLNEPSQCGWIKT